jgi:hypothetical protein
MDEKVASNYRFSRVNYTDAFMKLWVAFNGYYPDGKPPEINRVLSVVERPDFFGNYFTKLFEITPDRRVEFLLKCIEDLSTRTGIASNGSTFTEKTDDTSTKYKVHSDTGNVHTAFFRAARSADPILFDGKTDHLDKTRFCHDKGGPDNTDTVINGPYISYKKYLATETGIVFYADFLNTLPVILSHRGILQVGELLFTEISNQFNDLSNEIAFEETNSDTLGAFRKDSAKKLLVLELTLLYKLRCTIMHGNIDIQNDENADILSKAAYNALDSMMSFMK